MLLISVLYGWYDEEAGKKKNGRKFHLVIFFFFFRIHFMQIPHTIYARVQVKEMFVFVLTFEQRESEKKKKERELIDGSYA